VRWSSQLNSTVNNDLIRLAVFSIFALFILLGTNQTLREVLLFRVPPWPQPVGL
jgi:hypothetical protein